MMAPGFAPSPDDAGSRWSALLGLPSLQIRPFVRGLARAVPRPPAVQFGPQWPVAEVPEQATHPFRLSRPDGQVILGLDQEQPWNPGSGRREFGTCRRDLLVQRPQALLEQLDRLVRRERAEHREAGLEPGYLGLRYPDKLTHPLHQLGPPRVSDLVDGALRPPAVALTLG